LYPELKFKNIIKNTTKAKKDKILNLNLISKIKNINKEIIRKVLIKLDLSPIRNEIIIKKIAIINFNEIFLY
tara:strand:- start:241 stop:456 length:216 start_codon:yes stop_codon:yes gene_type:complete